jgi:2-amino-4-hydroxy-6-hydroxymethyldihydropteridine diphosphokinase
MNDEKRKLFITLGSNIDPHKNIVLAFNHLKEIFGQFKISKIYKSKAIHGAEPKSTQPDYINAAILTKSSLDPLDIKFNILRKIEEKLGRVRSNDKYAPRTIDLDIALYGSFVIDENEIKLPDPQIAKFAHLIYPLCDLDPKFIHPTKGINLRKIKKTVDGSKLEQYKSIKLE